MATVRGWAEARGYAYRFIDDALFDEVPTWFRDKVRGEVHLVSDLARLNLARRYLAAGFERACWVDADVIVFDPDAFALDGAPDHAFCREDFLGLSDDRTLEVARRVCNAVSLFARGNTLLDSYIQACEDTVRARDSFRYATIGTELLGVLNQERPLPVLDGVNLLSPLALHALATNAEPVLRFWMRHVGAPLAAGNLCATFRNRRFGAVDLADATFERVIATLLESRGAVLNRLLPEFGG